MGRLMRPSGLSTITQILVGGQSRVVHGQLIGRGIARLQARQIRPPARRLVLRDQDQRVRLKILASDREVDLLRPFPGPLPRPRHARHHRTAIVGVGRDREGSRKCHAPFDTARTVQLPGCDAGANPAIGSCAVKHSSPAFGSSP